MLPPIQDEFKVEDYELVKVCKSNVSSVISEHSASISSEGGSLYLNKLPEGTYRFVYRPIFQIITITVHKGQRWDVSRDYLIKEKSILKMMTQSQYIAYKDFQINDREVSFSVLSNNMNSVQVHAFAFSYVPSTYASLVQSVKSIKVDETSETFNLVANSNVFLSEKSLGDEIKYVLERKRKNTFMGNTLEKPSSLLKRHFVRETNQDQEQLKTEKDYGESLKRKATQKQDLAPIAARNATTTNYSVNNLNTFLGKEGWSQFNIHPNEDGKVDFILPENHCFGTLVFVIKDNKNSIVETRSLKPQQKNSEILLLLNQRKLTRSISMIESPTKSVKEKLAKLEIWQQLSSVLLKTLKLFSRC